MFELCVYVLCVKEFVCMHVSAYVSLVYVCAFQFRPRDNHGNKAFFSFSDFIPITTNKFMFLFYFFCS